MSLSDFQIVKKCGEGAFSEVYQVKRKSDGQTYALKKVKMMKLSGKEKENALNEVRILASFSHPNIVAYKEAFIDTPTSTLCIVMEFCSGGDILSKIKEHERRGSTFPEKQLWEIFA